jgi:hypothetical protein
MTNASVGSVAICRDGIGDVTTTSGSLPDVKMPGMDLAAVEVVLGTDALTVTFTASERIPFDAGMSPLGGEASLLWYLLTRTEDAASYLLQAELVGAHWYAGALDLVEARRVAPGRSPELRSRRFDVPSAHDRAVTAVFRREELPGLDAPLIWVAGTEWSDFDVYGDSCPDRSADATLSPASRLVPPGRLP